MNDTIARTELDRREVRARAGGPGGDDGAKVAEWRAGVFARELGAVGEVAWLLAKRAAVLAGRMERLAERDEVIVTSNVEAARDEFDRERRAERAEWASALNGDNPVRIAEAPTGLELQPQALDVLHRLWGQILEGIRSEDPATIAGAPAQARQWLGAMGTGTPGDASGLAARVAAEASRLRVRDDRTRPALERMMADARREVGLAAAFDPAPEAVLARRHEAAAERGFFRALKLICDLRRDAGLAPVAEAHAPLPAPEPAPAERPARPLNPPIPLGSFRTAAESGSIAPTPDPLASFRAGVEPDHRRREVHPSASRCQTG